MKFDVVIKNGVVIDGANMPRFFGDIGIKRGIIEQIGTNLSGDQAARVIDAAGKIVAPGVIDAHTHYDAQINWDPYCSGSSWHGSTTVVLGNCGFGFAPCRPEHRERYKQMMVNTEQISMTAMTVGMDWTWETYGEWMAHLVRLPKAINAAAYAPLNAMLVYATGDPEGVKGRKLTALERGRLRDTFNAALDAGALGLSLVHLGETDSHVDFDGSPMPTDIMDPEDIYILAEVMRDRDQGIVQVTTDTAGALENRHVSEELARISGRPVLHNVVFVSTIHPDHHHRVLEWIDACQRKGLNIYAQGGTHRAWLEFNIDDYNGWDSDPNFARFSSAGDRAAKLALAKDGAFRELMRTSYDPNKLGVSGTLESFQFGNAHGNARYTPFEGRRLGEIAQALGKPITDTLFDLLIDTDMQADFMSADLVSNDAEEVASILRHPRVIPGLSDGGAHTKFVHQAHYPTDLIDWLCRSEKKFSLEEAHFKLSALPAQILGLHRRGQLREGFAADLYIYDEQALGYNRDKYDVLHDAPGGEYRRVVHPRGIEWVMCNGQPILSRNLPYGPLPGRILSNQGSAADARINGEEPVLA